VNIE